MRIDKFLSGLLPFFKKDNLREELANIRVELNDTVLPIYDNTLPTLAKAKFTSREVQAFQKNWERTVKIDHRGNYVVGITSVLHQVRDNIDFIETLVERNFVSDVFRDAMTFARANVIQYVELMGFAVRYSRKLLLWTLYELSAEVDKKAGLVTEGVSKAEVKWLTDNALNFLQAMNSLGKKRAELESDFRNIPDAAVTAENVSTIEATVGVERTDPFQMNFIPTWVNPFFYVGKKIAEYQVNRYNQAVEEKKALELRLLNFKLQLEGKSDAKIQQAIEYSEDRLRKLNFRIAEMEADYLG